MPTFFVPHLKCLRWLRATHLCRMQGLADFVAGSSTCIVVTEIGQQATGFLIQELKAIDTALWEPEVSDFSNLQNANKDVSKKTQLVLFKIAGQEKMVQVKDFSRLPTELQLAGFQQPQDAELP